MFAELIINIEAPLENNFHYELPKDLQAKLKIGHLVEVEFGKRFGTRDHYRFFANRPRRKHQTHHWVNRTIADSKTVANTTCPMDEPKRTKHH